MSTFSHCQECGRRLTDVLFCPRCGAWFCCAACLAEDKARHLRSNAAQANPLKPAGAIARASIGTNTQAEIQFNGLISELCSPRGRRR